MGAFTFTVLFQNAFLSIWRLSLVFVQFGTFLVKPLQILLLYCIPYYLSLEILAYLYLASQSVIHACKLNFQEFIPLLYTCH